MTVTVVFFLGDERDSLLLVDVPRLCKHVVGPEHELLVATASSEANTFIDETGAKTQTARPGFDQEEAEFGDRFTTLHNKHGADDFTVHLGDPAAFSRGVVVVDKISNDLGHERFEVFVPAILLRVKYTMPVGDPAHIARFMRPQEKRLGKFESFSEHALDGLHGLQQPLLVLFAEVIEHL